MDIEAYTDWELAAVNAFSTLARPESALAKIAGATDELRQWTPGTIALQHAVRIAFGSSPTSAPVWPARGTEIARALNRGPVSLPRAPSTEYRVPNTEYRTPSTEHRLLANYLAARTFGNWIAYQGRGLRTIVTWLYACYDSVRALAHRDAADEREPTIAQVIEAIRHADYVMLHSIDSQDFANAAIEVEA